MTISLIIFPICAAYINPRITLSMRWQFKLDSLIRAVDSTVPKIFCALYIVVDLIAVGYGHCPFFEDNIITDEEQKQLYEILNEKGYWSYSGVFYIYHCACEYLV